jgi:nucleotide-binding universal stress UspA family protein
MTNPTSGTPQALSKDSAQRGQEPGQKLKVTLIVENSPSDWNDSAVLELTGLIAPAQVELSLIYVTTDLKMGLPPLRHNDSLEQSLQDLRERQEESKEALRRDVQVAGFEVQAEQSFSMESGNMQAILDYIQESGQDLLVLCGSHSPGLMMGRNHFFMNLTTHAPIPTLMLKRKIQNKGTTLKALFGVDASDASLNAARKLGRLIEPARVDITLATVQNPVYQENAILAPYVNQEILTEALEANSGLIFEMFTDILKPQGFKIADFKVLIGSPATELGYIAETDHPDLVVVGSHNHKGFLAWVMGSVSSQLLHWDNHNLLVIR